MFYFFTRRLGALLVTLLFASLVVFLVIRFLPGSPAQIILGMNAQREKVKRLREELGFDRPIFTQYRDWLGGVLTGDLGQSLYYGKSISSLLGSRLLVTLPLVFLSMGFAVFFAIPLGMLAARNPGSYVDYFVVTVSQIGISVPAFWIGILLLTFGSVRLGFFPAGGFTGWTKSMAGAFKSLLLPAFSLGVIRMSALVRMTRSATLEAKRENYVSAARAKGLAESVVLYKHVMKNAFISVMTLIGLQIGQLLAGAIVIENVFHLPGLGSFLLRSVESRDLPAVQGIVLFLVGAIIVINFLVDLAYCYLDPRIRYE